MRTVPNPFAEELRAQLAAHDLLFSEQAETTFLDFYWDEGWSVDEMLRLDPPVIVDVVVGPRRVVLQRVRNELRFCLITDRNPLARNASATLGVASSIDDAARICEQFLVRGESITSGKKG